MEISQFASRSSRGSPIPGTHAQQSSENRIDFVGLLLHDLVSGKRDDAQIGMSDQLRLQWRPVSECERACCWAVAARAFPNVHQFMGTHARSAQPLLPSEAAYNLAVFRRTSLPLGLRVARQSYGL